MSKSNKRIVILSMIAILTLSSVVPAFADKVESTEELETIVITDMPEQEWANEAVLNLLEKGILKGNKGEVRPDGFITRAEYAQILVNILPIDGKIGLDNVPDVKPSDWFYDAIEGVTAFGIYRGDNDSLALRPNDFMTREEIFVATARAFDIEQIEKDLVKDFKDAKEVSSWSKQYISALIENGNLKGNQENKLSPKNNITRAEVASMLSSMKEVKELEKIVSVTNK